MTIVHALRRIAPVALIAGVAAVPFAPTDASSFRTPRLACTWTPAADVLSFGPHLVGTVRVVDAEVEVLHSVRCTDGTERWLWMPASYDGA